MLSLALLNIHTTHQGIHTHYDVPNRSVAMQHANERGETCLDSRDLSVSSHGEHSSTNE